MSEITRILQTIEQGESTGCESVHLTGDDSGYMVTGSVADESGRGKG